MFAIPVARELFGGSTTVEWVLILIAGACMTASAYFGIKSLTIISYIAVPLVAVLGTVAMIMAVKQGDGTIVDQFAKSSGSLTVIGGAGLGLANIFNKRKKPMVLISGVIGTLLSVWLYYNFCGWLNILNCTLPPVGIILVISYFMNKKAYDTDTFKIVTVNWFAVVGVILGAIVANVVTWGIASINGMIVAALCYMIGEMYKREK